MPAARTAARKSGTAWGCGITGLAPAGAARPIAMAAPTAPTRTLANLSGWVMRSISISPASQHISRFANVVTEIDCFDLSAPRGSLLVNPWRRPDKGQPGKRGDGRQQDHGNNVPK